MLRAQYVQGHDPRNVLKTQTKICTVWYIFLIQKSVQSKWTQQELNPILLSILWCSSNMNLSECKDNSHPCVVKGDSGSQMSLLKLDYLWVRQSAQIQARVESEPRWLFVGVVENAMSMLLQHRYNHNLQTVIIIINPSIRCRKKHARLSIKSVSHFIQLILRLWPLPF